MVPSSTNRTIDEKWTGCIQTIKNRLVTELKDQISWYPNRVLTNIKNDIGVLKD